jgi:hypothetical protein
MEQRKFVIEGSLSIGPQGHPIFVDTKLLAALLIEYFQPPQIGAFYRTGRTRITVEVLDEEESS